MGSELRFWWALEDLNLRPLPCQGWNEHCETAGGSLALTKPLVSAFYWVPWYPSVGTSSRPSGNFLATFS
jgi:hypothetical protein